MVAGSGMVAISGLVALVLTIRARETMAPTAHGLRLAVRAIPAATRVREILANGLRVLHTVGRGMAAISVPSALGLTTRGQEITAPMVRVLRSAVQGNPAAISGLAIPGPTTMDQKILV